MQKDPYLVLGLTKGASEEEVKTAYDALKAKYSELRFEEGEVGMDATRKLAEIDQAYKDCMEDINDANDRATFGSLYGNIEKDIKAGNYDEAQRKLDDIDVRDAEWHYYQAMIYFKKGWHSESKSQLELCIALEPHNSKYNAALDKMNDYIKNQAPFTSATNPNNNSGQQTNNSSQRAGYSDRQTNADNNANACCNSCCTMMCCDSCCECMGGDLIPCC